MTSQLRKLEDAQHEAAHVVVGVSLGLKLARVWLNDPRPDVNACALFRRTPLVRYRAALALMFAAGPAWERAMRPGDPYGHGRWDMQVMRKTLGLKRRNIETYIRAAGCMLTAQADIHERVTRALLERDLTGADVAAIARGERLPDRD